MRIITSIEVIKPKQPLTPLEQKLFRYAKESKPVLLYGKDSVDRGRLVISVHRGRLGRNFEYIGNKKIPNAFRNSADYLVYEMRNAIADRNHEKIFELLRDSRLMSNSVTFEDCGLEDGKTVFGRLTDMTSFSQNELIDYYIPRMDEPPFECEWPEVFRLVPGTVSYYGDTNYSNDTWYYRERLIDVPGILFVNNLRCSNNDLKDNEYYEKLALKIEEGRKFNREEAQWLVAYAYDPNTFPRYFLDQFEPVSLDSKDYDVKQQKVRTVVVPVKEIAASENRQAGETGVKTKTILPQSKLQGKLIDKTPSGTKWSDVEMSLTDKEYKTLDISIKGGKPFTVNSREMGLESDHSHKPLKAWLVLIAFAFAENSKIHCSGEELKNFVASVGIDISTNSSTLFSHIAKLREKLSKSFGISEDPIPCDDKEGVYQTLFKIKDNSYIKEHKQSKQNLETIKCAECGESINNPDHDIDDEGDYICDNCKGTRHDRSSKEGTYNDYHGEEEWN